ncbi:internalin [Zooshikella sp. RANM57]|uniref:internalin n=1 Tax=Zooshikella sp. RANM57 TaxID=3425863 RepID=UPI003D6E802A
MKPILFSGLLVSTALSVISDAVAMDRELPFDHQPERSWSMMSERFGTKIPGLVNDHIQLGTAYDSTKEIFLNHQPVAGVERQNYGGVKFTVTYDQDTSYDEVLSMLNGSVDASVAINVVQVNAGAHIAKEAAESEYASSYTFSATATPKKRVLLPENANTGFVLSPVGDAIATQYQNQLAELAGDEFVTSIEYGSQLFVNMKVEFLNSRDKDNIGGYLGVDVAGGIVSVKGELDFLDEEVKKSVKITVRALQKGGNPIELLKVIPNNIITCSLENPKPCFDLFEEAIQYAKTDFQLQFDSLSDYNVVSYETTRYDRSTLDVKRLVPEYQEVSWQRDQIIYEMTDNYKHAIKDEQRASDLLASYYSWMPNEQRTKVEQIKQAAYNNAWLYYDIAKYCQEHPFGTECVDYWNNVKDTCASTAEEACIAEYDRSQLEVNSEVKSVHQCEVARQTATNNGLETEQQSIAYRNLRWAPVFVDNAKPSDGILEWTPCEFALATYGDYFIN